jgi:hypothetical protein
VATKTAKSYCRICAANCGVVLTIDTASQAILSVKGDKDNPVSQGYVCFKGLQAEEYHHGPQRLLNPLKRQGDGTFIEIGVEQALDELSDADVEGLASAPILRAAQAVARKTTPVSLGAVLDALGEEERRLVSAIAVEGVPAEHLSAEECVRELRRQPLLTRMAEIQKRLPGASGDALEALLQEKTRLVRQMTTL